MGISYPASVDAFPVPTLPEGTSLSSAGTANRAHTDHHRDLGLGLTAVMTNAALKTHLHTGADGTGKLLQANTHQSPDTDTAGGIHRTVGPGHEQAARGDHNHDYNDLLNVPWKNCTSTTRPANPIEGMLIYERDTRRFRQWATYPNNAISTGLFSIDYFARTSSTDIGTSLWELTYDQNPASNGKAATPDGNTMSWIDGGVATNRLIARRINAADAVTTNDDQVLTWKTGATVIEWEIPLIGEGAINDGYLRMSADKSSYVRVKVGFDYLKIFYTTTGRANEKHLGTLENINTDVANSEWRAQVVDRDFSLYRNGEFLGTIKDTQALTAKGAGNRGWALGMVAGQWGLGGQATPANIDWVSIADYTRYISASRWTLLPIASMPACRLRQGQKQKLSATGSVLEWTEEVEDNFDYFDPRSPGSVLVREPGSYRLEATLQWDPQIVPDVGHLIVLINGVETSARDSKYMRGNVFIPGFSQTLALSVPLRLAEGDLVQLKAKYTASANLLEQIFSWFDAPSNVKSRFDLTYIGP